MKTHVTVEQLLHWRLTQAESDAPPAPRAASLLERVRPWWQTTPEQLHIWVERLLSIQLVYGHALEERYSAPGDHPVPVLIVETGVEKEAWARLLYFNLHEGRLRLRLQVDGEVDPAATEFDVAFVSPTARLPILYGSAVRSRDIEYRLDTAIATDLADEWNRLRVTDIMPFRLILRPVTSVSGSV